jgi:hypothetical protein
MHMNPQVREDLLRQAELSYIGLMSELDKLFQLASFYIERYPTTTPGDIIKIEQLSSCINQLGSLPTILADVINLWKLGLPREIKPLDVEVNILIEIWANIQALMYFLLSNDIDIEHFSNEKTTDCFSSILRANRLLT